MRDFKEKMKKTGRAILFFAILTGLLAGLSRAITELSKRDDSLVQERNKNIVKLQREPENTIDVLFLGDSLGYTSFSPMQMWKEQGFTSYAGCQGGQKIHETYAMLETALETQSPKLVVLETNTMFRDKQGLVGMEQMAEEKLISVFPVFRFHDIWKPLLFGGKYGEDNYKGFLIRGTVSPYTGKDYMQKNDKKREITDIIRTYMENIQDLCEENGAELMLVSAPSPVNYNDQKHRALEEYAQENGLAYVDLNLKTEELGINWEKDTMDKGDHPNLSCAEKISRYMGAYLKEHYELEDHRGEHGYSAWDEEAKDYEKKVEEVHRTNAAVNK